MSTIVGVAIIPLRQLSDETGGVLHMMRADSPHFQKFGEIYFSLVNPGAIKAWRRHRKMVCNLTVPVGEVHFVLYDARDTSSSRGAIQEVRLGRRTNYQLLRIPEGIWYGFRGLATQESLVANCATLPHDPDEIERLPSDSTAIPWRFSSASVP